MSDPHHGPLAESNEAKFARVMKEFSSALRDADAATWRLPPERAPAIHHLGDLGIAARTTRLLAAGGLERGLLPALRDLAVLIPCLGRRTAEMRPKWQPSAEPNLPWEAAPDDIAIWEDARRALAWALHTRETLLEITDALYPR